MKNGAFQMRRLLGLSGVLMVGSVLLVATAFAPPTLAGVRTVSIAEDIGGVKPAAGVVSSIIETSRGSSAYEAAIPSEPAANLSFAGTGVNLKARSSGEPFAVPEPALLALFGSMLVALAAMARRKLRKSTAQKLAG
jgi:hypothetical protein